MHAKLEDLLLALGITHIELVVPNSFTDVWGIEEIYFGFVDGVDAPHYVNDNGLGLIAFIESIDCLAKCLCDVVIIFEVLLHLGESTDLGWSISSVQTSQDSEQNDRPPT